VTTVDHNPKPNPHPETRLFFQFPCLALARTLDAGFRFMSRRTDTYTQAGCEVGSVSWSCCLAVFL